MSSMTWWLFLHTDGRQRAVREDDLSFTAGDPKWVRQFPVAVVRDEATRAMVDEGRAALLRCAGNIHQEPVVAVTYRAMVARSQSELDAYAMAPCGCLNGTCESKTDCACRMASEIDGGAQ